MTGITDPGEEYFKDGVWAWVSTAWKKLVADASNFLQVNIAAQDIDVEVKQTTAADLTPGVMGWDGSAWRKLPLLWGYSDRLHEDLSEMKDGSGTYSKYSTAVPAGEIHVVQVVSLRNATGARGAIQIRVYANSVYVQLSFEASPAQYVPVVSVVPFVMKEGDRVRVLQSSAIDNDDIEGGAWGYKMKVEQ